MLMRLVFALALLCAAPATAREAMRQYFAETSTGVEMLTGELASRMPRSVALLSHESQTLVTWSGASLPPALASFLAGAFPDLEPDLLQPGRAMSLVASLTPAESGTTLSLMVLARFPPPSVDLPAGAAVMLDATSSEPCRGQIVLKHPGARTEVAALYRAHFEGQGFLFDDEAPGETSFLVGYAGGCALGLYFQRDGEATLVVARYLED